MSCIVGFSNGKKVWLAADSIFLTDWQYQVRRSEKLFKKGEFLFGVTGSGRVSQLLKYQLVIPEHPKGMSPAAYMATHMTEAVRSLFKEAGYVKFVEGREDLSASFLIGYRGQLYHFESDFQNGLCESGFGAVGVARNEALAVITFAKMMKLPPKPLLLKTLQAVAKMNVGICGPFKCLELEA